MSRTLATVAALAVLLTAPAMSAEIEGDYLESRDCNVFTGPCFANAESTLAGDHAIMAWSIDRGTHQGVDLAGLKVVMALRASDSLTIGGGLVSQPYPIKSIILVDERASAEQRDALAQFARQSAGDVAGEVVRVDAAKIDMQLDHINMAAELTAGDEVELSTRKLKDGDCVCTNEVVYYPPLAEVENSAPAFAIESGFNGRGLGSRWNAPGMRSAFLATFAY